MRHASRWTLVAASACLASVACNDAALFTAPRTFVESVTADTNSEGSILLHVMLSAPATVNVDYWTDPAYKLRVRIDELTAQSSIFLPGLRAGRTYVYEVSAVDASGRMSATDRGNVATPELPAALAQVRITAAGTSGSPLTMLEINGEYHGFVAVDPAGNPVWKWPTQGIPQGFTRRANGNFVFLDGGYGLFEVSPDGQVVHELDPLPGGNRIPHHDVVATQANTLLFLAQEPQTASASSIVGDAIWEWNPETGAVVKRWNAFDFFDPAVDFGARSLSYDWFHANSLAMGDHGNVILSLNWLDAVVSIAPDWRSLEWTAGGRQSSFVFDSASSFQGQHTAATLPNGHLLLFDNGRDRTGAARASRGLEVALDRAHGTAQAVWSFRPTPNIYAPYIGSARRLANGSTLVFFGLSASANGATGPIAGYEVRPDGSVAWQLSVANVKSVYRATPLTSLAGEVLIP